MLSVCLAVSVHSHNLSADTAAVCHFEEQLTFAFSLHQIHYWAWASDISDCVCLFVCICVCDELLGHAPMTFYWMLMVFIAMAAGGKAGIAVCVKMAPVTHL